MIACRGIVVMGMGGGGVVVVKVMVILVAVMVVVVVMVVRKQQGKTDRLDPGGLVKAVWRRWTCASHDGACHLMEPTSSSSAQKCKQDVRRHGSNGKGHWQDSHGLAETVL